MNKLIVDKCNVGDYIRWWTKEEDFSRAGKIDMIISSSPPPVLIYVIKSNDGTTMYVDTADIEKIIRWV